MQGLSSITKVEGIGIIEWEFADDYGVKHKIRIKANYIPSAKFRLFSPQACFLEQKAGSINFNRFGIKFAFAEGGNLTFNYAKGSILPFQEENHLHL